MIYSLALLCCRVPETSFNHLIHISIQAEENLRGGGGQFFFETDACICVRTIRAVRARAPPLPRSDLWRRLRRRRQFTKVKYDVTLN